MGHHYAQAARAEALATAWLIEQGYEVFSGVSGQESCDLIALRRGDATCIRVEVKHGHYAKTNVVRKLYANVRDTSWFDLLLVVSPEGEVFPDPTPDICHVSGVHPQVRNGHWQKTTE